MGAFLALKMSSKKYGKLLSEKKASHNLISSPPFIQNAENTSICSCCTRKNQSLILFCLQSGGNINKTIFNRTNNTNKFDKSIYTLTKTCTFIKFIITYMIKVTYLQRTNISVNIFIISD